MCSSDKIFPHFIIVQVEMLYQRYFLRMNQSNTTHILSLLLALVLSLSLVHITFNSHASQAANSTHNYAETNTGQRHHPHYDYGGDSNRTTSPATTTAARRLSTTIAGAPTATGDGDEGEDAATAAATTPSHQHHRPRQKRTASTADDDGDSIADDTRQHNNHQQLVADSGHVQPHRSLGGDDDAADFSGNDISVATRRREGSGPHTDGHKGVPLRR